MLYKLITTLDKYFEFEQVSAHCDIPCKIYDPITIQIAVLSMLRMVELINEFKSVEDLSLEQHATISRLNAEKEKQGDIVKHEIRIIWGDYFKEPQIIQFPEIHQLSHSIMIKASLVKQKIDFALTLELLSLTNRFAEVFWQSKNIKTFDSNCPYPPFQLVTYPILG